MDQVGLIQKLMALDPPAHLFGGWAEDALLHGKASRPHDDIDLLVWLDGLDQRVDQITGLGVKDWHVKFQAEPGKPIVVAGFLQGVELELIVAQKDRAGQPFFDLPFEGKGLRRVWLPGDTFQHPPSRLGAVEVRTLSPLALYHIREACRGVFGGFRDKDKVAQAKLRERFFPASPERDLQPRITEPAIGTGPSQR